MNSSKKPSNETVEARTNADIPKYTWNGKNVVRIEGVTLGHRYITHPKTHCKNKFPNLNNDHTSNENFIG